MSRRRLWGVRSVVLLVIVGSLAACTSAPPRREEPVAAPPPTTPAASANTPDPLAQLLADNSPLGPPLQQAKSRWTPVRWSDLPGLNDDPLHEAWNAWLKSCERPAPVFAPLCQDVRRLSIATLEEQRDWLTSRLQPYRVEALQQAAAGEEGLLTGYFEPLLDASKQPGGRFQFPLYQPPAQLAQRKPWYTRQEADTLAAAQAALRGRAIAYLADPVDVLILQIQGSGRLRVALPDGTQHLVRLSYAGSNDQPFKSAGRWLLDQGLVRDASWPAIKLWAAQNPGRVNELLWANPRMVFFKEEALGEFEAAFGPRGTQGVPLTPGRSIAVDAGSIPVGTPVWIASSGPWMNLQKLVLAQDTGGAISGGVRADYFTGWGAQAAELAGRLRQPLRMWVLWPKNHD
jgi:membrane-bound lytic murein transglycosylase A